MDKIEVGIKQSQETTTDLFLKWGNKKRLRCVRSKDSDDAHHPVDSSSYSVSGRRRIRRRINSRSVEFHSDDNNNISIKQPPTTRHTRNSEPGVHLRSENNRKLSPEKGSSTAVEKQTKSPVNGCGGGGASQKVKHVWPKLQIALTNKEKEEDFMAMKGCKPAHRPKKRPKMIQRSILLVSPGAWLTDITQDRYEVIEKKSTKKRPTGLKAMGSIVESDSE